MPGRPATIQASGRPLRVRPLRISTPEIRISSQVAVHILEIQAAGEHHDLGVVEQL